MVERYMPTGDGWYDYATYGDLVKYDDYKALEDKLHQLSEDHSHCEGLLHELGERASRAEGRLGSALEQIALDGDKLERLREVVNVNAYMQLTPLWKEVAAIVRGGVVERQEIK